ncbi:hypothetical protein [Nissabacter archeti]|uniref:hypothetical protein n=1 Tax=Yersiniaceae TaxID=1903411 RepID=UPI003B84642C
MWPQNKVEPGRLFQLPGIEPAEIGRASLVGQPVHLLSPLVASTYLLVGLAGVEFSDHQKYTFKWAFILCMIFLGCGLLMGLYPLYSVAG